MKIVCVDLDGVLADYSKGWQGVGVIGDPIPGAVEFTKRLGRYAMVVIYTTRCKGKLFDRDEDPAKLRAAVMAWLDKHGFYYDEVDMGQGKPIAAAYVDDRAVPCEPQRCEMPSEVEKCYEEAEYAVRRLLEK